MLVPKRGIKKYVGISCLCWTCTAANCDGSPSPGRSCRSSKRLAKTRDKGMRKKGVRVLTHGFCIAFACDGCLEDCVRRLMLVRSKERISWCQVLWLCLWLGQGDNLMTLKSVCGCLPKAPPMNSLNSKSPKPFPRLSKSICNTDAVGYDCDTLGRCETETELLVLVAFRSHDAVQQKVINLSPAIAGKNLYSTRSIL